MSLNPLLNFFIFAVVGEICIFFMRKFPPAVYVCKKLRFPYDCDLCLGFWTFLVLDLFFQIELLPQEIPTYLNIIITAATTSFIMWLFVLGWREQFSVIEV